MRIMAFNGKLEHADHFGMDEYSYKQFAPLLNYPNGIIYITGPTGSGKFYDTVHDPGIPDRKKH